MKSFLSSLFFIVCITSLYGQSTGGNITLDSFQQMLIGSNDLDSVYYFDKCLVYKLTISDSEGSVTNNFERHYFNSKFPHLQMVGSVQNDSICLFIDYNRQIVVGIEKLDTLKRAMMMPISAALPLLGEGRTKVAMLLGEKTLKGSEVINDYECKKYEKSVDTLSTMFYISSTNNKIPFSTANKVSMAKMVFNDSTLAGLLVKWIITNSKSRITEEKLLISIDDVNEKWNTKKYSIMGFSGGIFGSLLKDIELEKDTTEYILAIEKEGKYGIVKYVGDNEEVLIPYEYDDTKSLCDSLIAIQKDGLWNIYQVSQNKILDNLKCIDIERLGGLEISTIALQFPDGLWGLIDSLGNIISASKYDNVSYSEEATKIQKDGFWGLIDKNGKEITPPKYDDIKIYLGDYTAVNEHGKWGVISYSGKIILKPQFEDIKDIGELITVKKNNKWGYIDREGIVKIPFIYNEANGFSYGLASVKKGLKWGFIDKDNKTIIPFVYDYAANFGEEGRTRVVSGKKEFVIDKTGKCLEDCK